MIRRTASLLLCLILRVTSSQSMTIDPSPDPTPLRAFRSFERATERGLPQSSVAALAQDEEGVLWIGTLDGVGRFDGTTIQTVRLPPGMIPFGANSAIIARRKGGVFIGGSAGVHIFDGKIFTFLPTESVVNSLAETSDGSLWMTDRKGGFYRCTNPEKAAWEKPMSQAQFPWPAVLVASCGGSAAWVAWRDGVMRIEDNKVIKVAGGSLPPDSITALLVTPDEHCWIGTQKGQICSTKPGDTHWTIAATVAMKKGLIRCMALDRRGRIWAGCNVGTVCFGSEEAREWTEWGPANGIKPALVNAILADHEGSIWIGLNAYGLLQWIGEEWSHRNRWPGDLYGMNSTVFGINGTSDDGFLAADFVHGIYRWDGHAMTLYGEEDGLTENTRCAVQPEPGRIWVGARFGIFESEHGEKFHKSLDLPEGFIQGIFRSPDGDWYAASSSAGAFLLENGKWKPAEKLNALLGTQNVRGMTWRRNGELWVATMRGVAIFGDHGRADWLSSLNIRGMPPAANCVLEVSDGEVWVGGMGGIGIYDAGKWRMLTQRDGIPGNTIYSLARAQDGTIWAGGSDGIGHYSKGSWRVYDSRRGLMEGECNLGGLWIAPDGSVFVGTMRSLAHFDPRVPPLPQPSLRCYWRELPGFAGADGIIHLPASQSWLHFSWSAPWLLPTHIEYRTRVKQLGMDWSSASLSNELTLPDLGPGYWDIDVSAHVENTGTSSWTAPLHIRIYMAPHFWERRWVQLFVLMILIGAVFGIVRFRNRRLARRAEELQQRVDETVANMGVLRGLLPICAWCRKVRDDEGYWGELEHYIQEHTDADFSHGICPECLAKHFPDLSKHETGDRGSSE